MQNQALKNPYFQGKKYSYLIILRSLSYKLLLFLTRDAVDIYIFHHIKMNAHIFCALLCHLRLYIDIYVCTL